ALGAKITLDHLGLALISDGAGRSWFAVNAQGGVELVGVDGITLGGTLGIEVNNPANDNSVIDFTTMPNGGRTSQTGAAANANVKPDCDDWVMRAAGKFGLEIESYISVSGEFAFQKGVSLPAILSGTGGQQTLDALTNGAANVNIFAGNNG